MGKRIEQKSHLQPNLTSPTTALIKGFEDNKAPVIGGPDSTGLLIR